MTTFSQIYATVYALWPKQIDISDGEILRQDPADPADHDGGNFPIFSRTYNCIDDRFTKENDPHKWHSLMAWTMFQILHAAAVAAKGQGALELESGDFLNKKTVESRFFGNLKDGEWAQCLDRI